MKKNHLFLLILLIFSLVLNGFGQNGKNDPSQGNNSYEPPLWVRDLERQQRKIDEQFGKDKNGMIVQPPLEESIVRPMTEEEKEIFAERMKNYAITMRRLQAPATYYKKYESFLKDGKTGLARLFLDLNCDEGKTVTVEELKRCGDVIPVKGGGSYYSFRVGTNAGFLRDWWDLHFVNENFRVGNDSVQAVIAQIGDIDLEAVNLNSMALTFLKKHKAKKTLQEIKKQNKVLEKGIESNGFTYSNLAPVKLNSTYVMRSTAYFIDDVRTIKIDDFNDSNRFYGSGRGMDVILVFKVVGREADGSLILLWKELKLDLPRKKLL